MAAIDADAMLMLVAFEHSEAAIRPLQDLGHSPRAARGALRRAEGNSIRAANELTERAGRLAANRARPTAMAGEVTADGSLIDAESLSRVRRGAKRASESARLDALKRHRNDADAAIAELTAPVDPTALASLVSMGAEAGAAEDALRAASVATSTPPRRSSSRRPRHNHNRNNRRHLPTCPPTTRTARQRYRRRASWWSRIRRALAGADADAEEGCDLQFERRLLDAIISGAL